MPQRQDLFDVQVVGQSDSGRKVLARLQTEADISVRLEGNTTNMVHCMHPSELAGCSIMIQLRCFSVIGGMYND